MTNINATNFLFPNGKPAPKQPKDSFKEAKPMKGDKMDNARKPRKFPAYTLEQLKAAIERAGDEANPESLATMRQEIADRESGASVHFSTPQVT